MFKKLWNTLVPEKEASSTLKFNGENISAENLDRIAKAKNHIVSTVKYPQALVFHDLYTKVNGSVVTLRFTCNGEVLTQNIETEDAKN
jgi:hypothetical protein